ncbi:MAG: polysaccharide deacetylase family protein [Bacillota bacterium]|nr:polysaccharide deacetylase family protein [Bacillota bacterium]
MLTLGIWVWPGAARAGESAEGAKSFSTPQEALLEAGLSSVKEPWHQKWALIQAASLLRELHTLQAEGEPAQRRDAPFWHALASVARSRPRHLTVQALTAMVETCSRGSGPERLGVPEKVQDLAQWVLSRAHLEADVENRFVGEGLEMVALGSYWLGRPFECHGLRDLDGDGLPDWYELVSGSSPWASDSDGDGKDDGTEVLAGSDPRLPPPAPHRDDVRSGAAGAPGGRDVSQAMRPSMAYLTFDDGPSADVTPLVLDVLALKNVKATFFLIGSNAARNPGLVVRMKDEGHSVGNHTWNHDYRAIYASAEAYAGALDVCGETLYRIIGSKPVLTRAPGGEAGHFTPAYWGVLKARGYRCVGWNVSGRDAVLPRVSSEEIMRAVLNGARRAKGDVVILLHDGPGHLSTARAVSAIIEGLQDLGFVLDRIEDDTAALTVR